MSKKILVVSDSHGDDKNLHKAISYFGERGRDLELFIHLGDSYKTLEMLQGLVDCPVEAVRGNGDFDQALPTAKLIQIGEEKVFITHGHRYGCKMGFDMMADIARENGAGMVLFGHTHMPVEEQASGVWILNPGSISRPRQYDRRPTYLVLTLEDHHIEHSIVRM